MEYQNLGVALDPRSEEEKAKDYQAEEVASFAPVEWKENKETRSFPVRNQSMSLSCMAQSGVKMLGVENDITEGQFVILSAKPVYDARANFPSGGMWQQNLFDILTKPYACLESQLNSQNLSETPMNASFVMTDEMKATAEKYRAAHYVFLEVNIDKIASLIQEGKAVHLMMFFTGEEYWQPIPKVLTDGLTFEDPRSLRHGITAVDFLLKDGEKCLVIEDSAGLTSTIPHNPDGTSFSGQRLITESFLNARGARAGYLLDLANKKSDTNPKPKHQFTTILSFGMTGNSDVKELQNILKYEGLFPDSQPSTGNYFQITAKAVKAWQVKHGIMDFANTTDLTKIRFGNKSIALANSLYGV